MRKLKLVRTVYIFPNGNLPPETAKVAKKFYKDNLKHLEGDFNWTPWAKEQLNHYYNKLLPSNDEDARQQSLNFIDGLEKEMHQNISDRFESAREEAKQADPNDINVHQDIRNRLEEDISCFRMILNGISWFFKKLWWGISWPFKKLGQLFCWLFGWD